MATHPVLKAAGLYTADNPFTAVPEGAMVKAENAVMRYRHKVNCRRGQEYHPYDGDSDFTTFGLDADRSNEAVFYDDGFVVHAATNKLCRGGDAITPTDYSGTYAPVDATQQRMKFVEANSNLYFNTSVGVKLLTSLTATPAAAGVPRAFDVLSQYSETALYVVESDGWMAADTACAYKFVWALKDANDNVKRGVPSRQQIVRNRMDIPAGSMVRNANVVTVTVLHSLVVGDTVTVLNPDVNFAAGPHTLTVVPNVFSFRYAETAANFTSLQTYYLGGDRNVHLGVSIPPGITTSHFLQVYRTAETDDADTTPDTEFFLQSEIFPSSAEITAGGLEFTDRTPTEELGPPLYTNPNTGDGIAAAKFPPIIGKDMCWFDNRLWLFNTTDKQRFHLRLLGVGSPDGIQNNDTITINGTTFTAKTSPTPGGTQFQIVTANDSSGKNIRATAGALIQILNANYDTTGILAYYESGEEGAPGMILLEAAELGEDVFSVYASRIASWGPALTVGSSGAVESVNDRRPHGASFSTQNEPEAFPLTNWIPIGNPGKEILRAIPFRDKLFAFAENGKAYTVSGPYPYRVDELDGSAKLIAPDSVKIHANQCFALTDQGVGILTDAGFRIVSTGIEDDLLDVMRLDPEVITQRAFAVSYESERQYQIWLPTDDDDTCAQIAFVYNSLHGTWTKWVAERTWGLVSPADGKLYMGDGTTNRMRRERKALDRTDFVDEQFAVNIVSKSGLAFTLTSSTGITVGDMLWQSENQKSIVTAIDGNVVTVFNDEDFDLGFCWCFVAIDVSLKFSAIAPGGPSTTKTFRAITAHFEEFFSRSFEANFDTEVDIVEDTATLKTPPSYGLTNYGGTPYGDPLGMRNRRVEVTRDHVSGGLLRVGFTVREAYAIWTLLGFTLEYEMAGEGGRP